MTNYGFLLSLILYAVPILLMFFMGLEIYLRDHAILNKLSSALFICMLLLFVGSFFTAVFPIEYVPTLTIWMTLLPSYGLIGFAIHFSIRLTSRFDTWSRRKVIFFSYLPSAFFLFLFVPSPHIYVDTIVRGIWKFSQPSPLIFLLILVPSVYTIVACAYFLTMGSRHVKRLGMLQKQKQLRIIMSAVFVGGFSSIILSWFNRYLRISEQINYPEPSMMGIIFFALAIRYAIIKHEFLPSIEHKYQILFERSPCAILLVNSKSQIIEVNPAAQRLFQKDKSVLTQTSLDQLLQPYTGDYMRHNSWDELRVTAISGTLPRIVRFEKEQITSGGECYEFQLLWDITETILAEEHITFMAYHDSLTKLGNRRCLQESLTDILQNIHTGAAKSLAVILLDLDRFKHINDSKGHHVGDLVLQHVADLLRTMEHQPEVIARLGGDEFAILYKDNYSESDLAELCTRIIDGLNMPFYHQKEQYYITASIGVYRTTTEECPELIMQYADLAMYESKRQGRNRYSFFTSDLKLIEEQRHTFEGKLREAIHCNSFSMYFQPQIDLNSGKLYGVEALIRWIDRDGTVIPPDEFIPLAEESGLIVPLGLWVLRSVCNSGMSWINSGMPEIQIAVNVSNRELLNPHWISEVEDILQSTGFPARLLQIEITESVMTSSEPHITKMFSTLKDKGITLAIDDFGTGYSTFSTLQSASFQQFKIDRSIIKELGLNQTSYKIARAMIAMAHSLDLHVVAEGVENLTQAELLKQLSCNAVQGYYFSRPLPEDQFIAWYQEKL